MNRRMTPFEAMWASGRGPRMEDAQRCFEKPEVSREEIQRGLENLKALQKEATSLDKQLVEAGALMGWETGAPKSWYTSDNLWLPSRLNWHTDQARKYRDDLKRKLAERVPVIEHARTQGFIPSDDPRDFVTWQTEQHVALGAVPFAPSVWEQARDFLSCQAAMKADQQHLAAAGIVW